MQKKETKDVKKRGFTGFQGIFIVIMVALGGHMCHMDQESSVQTNTPPTQLEIACDEHHVAGEKNCLPAS